jgi:hypothetical protein
MAKASLVGPEIETGEGILRSLDAAAFPVTVAMWIFKEKADEWKLLLGTPLYDKLGVSEAYHRLIGAMSREQRVALSRFSIRLEGNRHPLIKELRKTLGKTAVQGMRLSSQAIGGVWIDDAYVYRIK